MHYTQLENSLGNNLIANGASIIVHRIYAPAFGFLETLNFFEADQVTPIMDIVILHGTVDWAVPFLAKNGVFVKSNRGLFTGAVVFHTAAGT
jgi:hypothetical protein